MIKHSLAAKSAWQTKVAKSAQSGKLTPECKGSTQKSTAYRTSIVVGVFGKAQEGEECADQGCLHGCCSQVAALLEKFRPGSTAAESCLDPSAYLP